MDSRACTFDRLVTPMDITFGFESMKAAGIAKMAELIEYVHCSEVREFLDRISPQRVDFDERENWIYRRRSESCRHNWLDEFTHLK